MSEQTWGFDIQSVSEGGFNEPPVGHYTMEIVDTPFKTNKNGEEYLHMVYGILDSEDSEWIGKKYYQYCSLDPERLKYAKGDWRRMGVPDVALTNDGGPQMMIGTVFECDLVRTSGKDGREFLNMRQIKPVTRPGEALPAEKGGKVENDVQPPPKRATPGRR